MLIHSASQLLNIGGRSAARSTQLGQLGLIEDGAVLIEGDRIVQ
jgi:hypothetical protein